ncbi:MAG: ribose 5-phosphate isomerase B [Ignavibacteriaceae bacterium]|jgi:ribose 5-phosphate isomerase B|nr:ribose 5-phosphate isomerase B [Ignavibacteriaceae bacterium]
MKIILGADHGGFETKEKIKEYLLANNFEIIDAGNLVYDAKDDYPDFAISVAKRISANEAEKGIIICGSGVGACIAANKVKGVRACVCHDVYSAHQGVEHDDMNVLCLGGRIIGIETAKEIVLSFANARFSNEERHKRRLEKVLKLEE